MRTGNKCETHRQVSFRMRPESYAVFAEYAAAFGADLSAVLNLATAAYLPVLLRQLADHKAAMAAATARKEG